MAVPPSSSSPMAAAAGGNKARLSFIGGFIRVPRWQVELDAVAITVSTPSDVAASPPSRCGLLWHGEGGLKICFQSPHDHHGAGPDGHPHASRFAARCLPRVAFLAAAAKSHGEAEDARGGAVETDHGDWRQICRRRLIHGRRGNVVASTKTIFAMPRTCRSRRSRLHRRLERFPFLLARVPASAPISRSKCWWCRRSHRGCSNRSRQARLPPTTPIPKSAPTARPTTESRRRRKW